MRAIDARFEKNSDEDETHAKNWCGVCACDNKKDHHQNRLTVFPGLSPDREEVQSDGRNIKKVARGVRQGSNLLWVTK